MSMGRFFRIGGAAVVAALFCQSAAAQTWAGGGANGNWSTPANWSGGTPASGAGTALTFGGVAQLATTQDIANPFLLNSLTFQAGAGAFTVGGAELRFGGAANALTQSSASPITFTAPVSFDGPGTIGGTGAGSLTFGSLHARQGVLTFTRNATVGALTLGTDGGAAASVSTGTNVLTLTGDVTFVQLTDPAAGFANTPQASLNGVIDLGGANRTFAGIYSNETAGATIDLAINARLTGSGGFVKGGSPDQARAWMIFNAQNDYAGPTILQDGAERLYLGVVNALPAGTAVTVANESSLFLTNTNAAAGGVGFSQTIGSLSDGGTGGGVARLGSDNTTAAVLTVGSNNASTTFAGAILGGGSLVKVGTGTLTLSGNGVTNNGAAVATNYTGGTTVNAGTLLVNGQTGVNSGTGTGTVVVNAAGTLGGTGRVAGPVTLRGRLQGGDGLTAAGNPTLTTEAVTFENGSRMTVAVGGATPATAVNSRITTSLAFNRTTGSDVMTLDLFNAGTLDLSGTQNYSITVAQFGSTNAAASNFALNPVNFTFAGTPLVTVNGASLVVQFTPVPEPGVVWGVVTMGLGWIGFRRWLLR
jgi:fibronectin-binding autotransporter adhesin